MFLSIKWEGFKYMKKVAILCLDDIRHVTMIDIYRRFFDSRNIKYDIICPKKYSDSTSFPLNILTYDVPGVTSNKIKKLVYYYKYRSFAIDLLKKNNYSFIVVWGEHTAVLFCDYLRKTVPYCINIRDTKFPKIPFYFSRLEKAVSLSVFSTWCAPRGVELLPVHDYVIVLNQNKDIVKNARINKNFIDENECIKIGVVGYIRQLNPAKELMLALKNDNRYILQFFGTKSESLKEYAYKIGMKNIELEGTFKPEETYKYLDRIDVINSYIGDGIYDRNITLGAPIRFGYSTLLYKPSIVSPNTYLSTKTHDLNIGFTVNDLKAFPDEFYRWYHSLNFEEFKHSCDKFNKEYDDSLDNLYKICDKNIGSILRGI